MTWSARLIRAPTALATAQRQSAGANRDRSFRPSPKTTIRWQPRYSFSQAAALALVADLAISSSQYSPGW